MKKVSIKNISSNPMPSYQTEGSAGMDISASSGVHLQPGETTIVPTGLFMEIPQGMEGQIRSRSGLSLKGVVVANSPGTIDSDYRGEVGVILHNRSGGSFTINKGDRIAQMVFCPVHYVQIEDVEEVGYTNRGTGGFGSTGGFESGAGSEE